MSRRLSHGAARSTALLLLALLLLALMAPPVQAEVADTDAREVTSQPPADQVRKRLLERFDENRDSKLNLSERRIAREMLYGFLRRQRDYWQSESDRTQLVRMRRERRHDLRVGVLQIVQGLFDQDGDGQLSASEIDVAYAGLRPELIASYDRIAKALDRLDDRMANQSDMAASQLLPTDEDRVQQALEQFDDNRDGQLDDQERELAGAALSQQRDRELLKEFDQDADGALDDQERAAARRVLENRFSDSTLQRRSDQGEEGQAVAIKGLGGDSASDDELQRFLERFDADGDGMLDEDEREQAREAFRLQRHRELIEHFDLDGDGELNEEERAAARAALERKLRNERERDNDENQDSNDKQNRRQARDGLQVGDLGLSGEGGNRYSTSPQGGQDRGASENGRGGRSGGPDSGSGRRSRSDGSQGSQSNDRSAESSGHAADHESDSSGASDSGGGTGKQGDAGNQFGEGSFPGEANGGSGSSGQPGSDENSRESFQDFQERSRGSGSPSRQAGADPGGSLGPDDLSSAFEGVESSEGATSEPVGQEAGIQQVTSDNDSPDF